MRGRKPKPTEQRVREGNPGKRPLPAPVLVGGRVSEGDWGPPKGLPADGKAIWNEVVPYLTEVGMLDMVDRPAIELLCTQFARVVQARKRLAHDGIFTKGSRDNLRPHPALMIEREATRQFLSIAEQFGLTPVARTRLGLAEVHRRTLQQELERDVGKPDFQPVEDSSALTNQPVDAEVVE